MSSWQTPQAPRPDDRAWTPAAPTTTGTPGGHLPGNVFGAPAATAPRRSRAAMFLASTALAAVVGAGAGIGGYTWLGTSGLASAPVSAVPVAQPSALDGSVTAAAKKISPSVVTITVQTGRGTSIGSGVVLDASGHILTNDHVVSSSGSSANPTSTGNSAASIIVTFEDGSTAQASVVGTSAYNDLAVIKVTGAKSGQLVPATFANSSSVVVGQTVVAVGAPLGLSETVTSGIVSATARPVRSGTTGQAVYQAVQTDAAINPGNSGGPLVNLNGQVIGINAAGASLSDTTESGNIGLGFAIPADVAVRIANELIEHGTAADAVLGVRLDTSDSGTDPTAGGVRLAGVTDGGPAQAAGLRAGDVVTAVDGVNTATTDGLIAAIRFHAPGSKVSVAYLRNGSTGTAQITLGSS